MPLSRIVMLIHPRRGGTYSVFRNLRVGLAAHGSELRWVGIGPSAAKTAADPQWADELQYGDVIDAPGASDRDLARRVIAHLDAAGTDAVIVNILTSPLQMNLARFLPARFPRLGVFHSISPGTYACARAVRDYIGASAAVSERIRTDLVRRHRFDPARTFAIPNAVDVDAFRALPPRTASERLRLLYLGRIVDTDKGVFWLPEILRQVQDLPLELTVAGDGVDLPALRRKFAGLESRVSFTGAVAPAAVPELVNRHDVLIMPSRFEGFGLVLIEAMAGGCVPVVSRIRGVTEVIVRDGESGILIPVGDVKAAASGIRTLATDATRRARMAAAASADVQVRYSAVAMGKAYLDALQVAAERTPICPPLDLEQWAYPREFFGGIRRFVPEWAKNILRRWRA